MKPTLSRAKNMCGLPTDPFEMSGGQFGHPYVQQEVCVIERTIRQEPLGANILNFGLQGSSIKSVRADVGNSLLALVPGSQHQIRPNYQPVASPRSTFASSNPQAYPMGSVNSGTGSWPVHLSNMSSGSRVSSGGSGHGADPSFNMLGREVNLSILGREANLAPYSRMSAGQDCLESNLMRASGMDTMKQNTVPDNGNDVSGPFPQWLTDIVSRRQRLQNMQSPSMFSSGGSFPRVADSSRDVGSGMGSLLPPAASTTRGARVVCTNYETGQRIGGELCLTQSGLFGVLCSCHGSHMSVAKFTQHVGIYSTNPGNVVVMDGTGESLVQWRRVFFSQYEVKVPEDNQGWDWSEGDPSESGHQKYKAVVTQSWKKEVDVSYDGEPVLKSRVTQVWDASLSPAATANFHSTHSLTNMGLLSNLGEGVLDDSRESFLKSFGRAFRGNSIEFGSCTPTIESVQHNAGRSQGTVDVHSLRSPSQLGGTPGEFFNFISGSQQFVSAHAEQQVAVGRQMAVGSRSLLKGLDLSWSDGREPLLQHEKDNSLSSFELRLGQPSQQSQPVGASLSSTLAMQRVMHMQRGLPVLDTRRQQDIQSTSAVGLHTFSGHQGPSNERPLNQQQQNFERTSFMEQNRLNTLRVDPNRVMEGSVLVDHTSFKRMEDVANCRFTDTLTDRESILSRDVGHFSTDGARRWPSAGSVGRTFMSADGLLINSEHQSKQWENEAQHQIGSGVWSLSQAQQDLDTIWGQEWISKSRSSQQTSQLADTLEGTEAQAGRHDSLIKNPGDCAHACREACGKDKDQFAYGDVDVPKEARDGQGCLCTNCGKLGMTILKERSVSKHGEQPDFYLKEVESGGNQVEHLKHSRDAGQGLDSSSPRVRRLRLFQALTSQGCSHADSGAEEHCNQASRILTAGSAPVLVSVAENESGIPRTFGNAERVVPKPGLRESNNETFQWKEMGGIFVPGGENLVDAAQDVLLPPRVRLEEDLLADSSGKANSSVAVRSCVSDKHQPVSDVGSKSSENALSGFSDGTGAEEEVSNAQSNDKNHVESEVVDEGSGIGKSSSSDGVDMGLAPGLNILSKDHDTHKDASPSSRGYTSVTNTGEDLKSKMGTRSRRGYSMKEPSARHEDKDVVDREVVEKKRRRTMKLKWLDATIDAANAKRQKPYTPDYVAKEIDAQHKAIQGSDSSYCLEDKSNAELSPSMCGRSGTIKARKIIVTHGNRVSQLIEHGLESNVLNDLEELDPDERFLEQSETLGIRGPQNVKCKKAKRSGRSKLSWKRNAAVPRKETTVEVSPATEMVNVEACTVDSFKESGITGSFIPESAAVSTISLQKHLSSINVQPVKQRRVILGRPSPRNATRMVSLNDIMNKPEVLTIAASTRDGFKPPDDEDGSKAVGPKEVLMMYSSKDSLKVSVEDDSKAASLKDDLKAASLREIPKASLFKDGIKASSLKGDLRESFPKEGLKLPAPKEGLKLKVSSLRDGLKVSPSKDGLKVSAFKNSLKAPAFKDGLTASSPRDGLKVPSPKDGLKASFPQHGLKVFSPNDGVKASTLKDGLKLSIVKDGLKVSSPKNGLTLPSPKNGFKVSSANDCSKVMSSAKDDLNGISSAKNGLNSAKDGLKVSSAKGNLKVYSSKDSLKFSSPNDGLKGSPPVYGLTVSGYKEGLKVSSSKDRPTAFSPKDNSKEPAPRVGLKIRAPMDCLIVSSPKGDPKAAPTRDGQQSSANKIDLQVPVSRDTEKSSAPKDGPKLVGLKDHMQSAAHKGMCKESLLKNGFKATALKDRLKISAPKVSSSNLFPLHVTNVSASKEISDSLALKNGLKPSLTEDSLRVPFKSKTEGKGHRKIDSGISVIAISQENQDKETSLAFKTWKESSDVNKSHKHEVRKVRSLHELTAEKKVPGPGGVCEFREETVDSSQVLKQDPHTRLPMQSEKAFSVPVHFSESKCFVPRGERSPRGKLSKMKNVFWQNGKDGHVRVSRLAAEPVEIVVGRSLVEDPGHEVGSRVEAEKERLQDIKSCPLISRIRFPLKKNKYETNDVIPTIAHVPSSMVVVEEVPKEKIMGSPLARPQKRALEQLDVVGSIFKKPKLLGAFGNSEPGYGLLKIRPSESTSTPSAPTLSSSQIGGLEVKDKKIKRQAIEDDLKSAGKKKRSQRSKWLDCRVPEGVVECCVCGSSISEFFNQLVCCARCPVKVHQACYGVKKIPNSAWLCRTCKASASHPICVLCGYGEGAMTRAQKAKGFMKGLVKAWQEKAGASTVPHSLTFPEKVPHAPNGSADHHQSMEKHELNGFCTRRNQEDRCLSGRSDFDSIISCHPTSTEKQEKFAFEDSWMSSNSVTSGSVDSTVVQWVHMVCALWMPGTRCLNFGTMGVFDVKGVAQARRRLICSICNRKGGACIQCRVVKCGVPFHAWCAHEKGLLQSEIVEDGSDQVGFFGKCLRHGRGGNLVNETADFNDIVSEVSGSLLGTSTCARTEGYKGKLTLEERALYRRQATRNGSAAVSPEQVAAWLRINERKTCKARRFLKSTSSDQKTDHREYLRFKQEQGWRRLSVYKSGIHALGLYTSEFIGRGEMVVEYIGEIVGLRVADKREADYHSGKRLQYQGACYLFRIDRERIIDATRKGGIARFVNHSCSPNCVAKVICVKNQSKVIFFAQRDIYAGEEITYDYQFNFEQEGDKIPCFCGSANCRGTLN